MNSYMGGRGVGHSPMTNPTGGQMQQQLCQQECSRSRSPSNPDQINNALASPPCEPQQQPEEGKEKSSSSPSPTATPLDVATISTVTREDPNSNTNTSTSTPVPQVPPADTQNVGGTSTPSQGNMMTHPMTHPTTGMVAPMGPMMIHPTPQGGMHPSFMPQPIMMMPLPHQHQQMHMMTHQHDPMREGGAPFQPDAASPLSLHHPQTQLAVAQAQQSDQLGIRDGAPATLSVAVAAGSASSSAAPSASSAASQQQVPEAQKQGGEQKSDGNLAHCA